MLYAEGLQLEAGYWEAECQGLAHWTIQLEAWQLRGWQLEAGMLEAGRLKSAGCEAGR